jgi:hypothetical protein
VTYDDWKADIRNVDGSAPQDDDEMPEMICPQCGAKHPDYDGFGFLAHTNRLPYLLLATPRWRIQCDWCGEIRIVTMQPGQVARAEQETGNRCQDCVPVEERCAGR